ncbi:MAG: hypothetical protein ACK559_41945, partial [bacterium]
MSRSTVGPRPPPPARHRCDRRRGWPSQVPQSAAREVRTKRVWYLHSIRTLQEQPPVSAGRPTFRGSLVALGALVAAVA